MYTVAVDIGGTFTDVVVIEGSSGHTVAGKALTTPADLQKGVLDGLQDAAANLKLDTRALLAKTKTTDAQCHTLAADGRPCISAIQELYMKLRTSK